MISYQKYWIKRKLEFFRIPCLKKKEVESFQIFLFETLLIDVSSMQIFLRFLKSGYFFGSILPILSQNKKIWFIQSKGRVWHFFSVTKVVFVCSWKREDGWRIWRERKNVCIARVFKTTKTERTHAKKHRKRNRKGNQEEKLCGDSNLIGIRQFATEDERLRGIRIRDMGKICSKARPVLP